MEILFKNLSSRERQHPHLLQPMFVCDVPGKTTGVHSRFTHGFFGFIYEGEGQYQVAGERFKVQAPAVISQWPGPEFVYGPSRSWSELYVRFHVRDLERLEARGIWSRQRPCYPVTQGKRCRQILELLQDELRKPMEAVSVDQIDRLIELLMMNASVSAIPSPAPSAQAVGIRRLQAELRADPASPRNWQLCAKQLGMSDSSFRRHWLEQIGVPPARYLTRLRLEQASRLLLTTRLDIAHIAARVGYEDPLYFSRMFRQHFQQSPRSFRREGPSAYT